MLAVRGEIVDFSVRLELNNGHDTLRLVPAQGLGG